MGLISLNRLVNLAINMSAYYEAELGPVSGDSIFLFNIPDPCRVLV